MTACRSSTGRLGQEASRGNAATLINHDHAAPGAGSSEPDTRAARGAVHPIRVPPMRCAFGRHRLDLVRRAVTWYASAHGHGSLAPLLTPGAFRLATAAQVALSVMAILGRPMHSQRTALTWDYVASPVLRDAVRNTAHRRAGTSQRVRLEPRATCSTTSRPDTEGFWRAITRMGPAHWRRQGHPAARAGVAVQGARRVSPRVAHRLPHPRDERPLRGREPHREDLQEDRPGRS